MWIARLLPLGTDRYNSVAGFLKVIDPVMKAKPIEWLSFWILFGAGVGLRNGQFDRYYFWNFSGWIVPVLICLSLTVVMAVIFKNRPNWLAIESRGGALYRRLGIYVLTGLVLLEVGRLGNPSSQIIEFLPYLFALVGVYLLFCIPGLTGAEETNQSVDRQRRRYGGPALAATIAAMATGVMFDDPVISTAAVVFSPFLIVVLATTHPRHVQRARIYANFIYGFFISMRAPWLLVLMIVWFFSLRWYNYFRFGITYPKLIIEAVSDDDNP